MYDFVFKLNLATTEGKERFLRRWAVGRMTNGQSTSPRATWKFLKSIGVDVPLPVGTMSIHNTFTHVPDPISWAACYVAVVYQ